MQALILAIIRTMETTSARGARLSREHAQRQRMAQQAAKAAPITVAAMDSKERAPYPFHA